MERTEGGARRDAAVRLRWAAPSGCAMDACAWLCEDALCWSGVDALCTKE